MNRMFQNDGVVSNLWFVVDSVLNYIPGRVSAKTSYRQDFWCMTGDRDMRAPARRLTNAAPSLRHYIDVALLVGHVYIFGKGRNPMKTKALFLDNPASYVEMADAQDRLLSARIADEIGDTVLFVEHLPVVTIGRSGDVSCLLKSPRSLARKGIAVFQSTRGGNVTYHAPGQMVMYPILKLTGSEADVHCYTTALEEIAIRTAADFKVPAFRRSGMTGAWTEHGKLAAIGVKLKRWTTSHGMSFNVNIDLSGFNTIVPCGLRNERVTSLAAMLGEKCPRPDKVRERMARHFSDVVGRQLEIRRMTSEAFLGIPQVLG